mmetsp:Transcript_6338/g.25763  ORF Transcript_6338/g.25763 Transcript_6338/m.25763 type:complete len:255 (+) Transcript_6338:1243-2007(+)
MGRPGGLPPGAVLAREAPPGSAAWVTVRLAHPARVVLRADGRAQGGERDVTAQGGGRAHVHAAQRPQRSEGVPRQAGRSRALRSNRRAVRPGRGGPPGAAVRAAKVDAGPGDDGPAGGEEWIPRAVLRSLRGQVGGFRWRGGYQGGGRRDGTHAIRSEATGFVRARVELGQDHRAALLLRAAPQLQDQVLRAPQQRGGEGAQPDQAQGEVPGGCRHTLPAVVRRPEGRVLQQVHHQEQPVRTRHEGVRGEWGAI